MKTSLLTKYLYNEFEYISSVVLSINKDSDIEYLHGFRVSIRKSRSLLKLFFSDNKSIQKQLKKIAKKTNILRELDIFLNSLNQDLYPKLYGSILKARESYFDTTWTSFFVSKTIKKLQLLKIDLQNLNCTYKKKEYKKITHSQFDNTVLKFNNIKADDCEEKLHKIRIEFKNSRYALEFLDKTKLSKEKKRIKKCKQTQEYLGQIQDKANQIDWLKSFCLKLGNSKECKLLIKNKQQELVGLKQMANKRA